MAIVEAPGPLALPSGAPSTNGREHPMGVFARPGQSKGWRSWITSVDHKRVGVMYGATAILFFLVGGIEALLIRLQLAHPNGTVLNAAQYNQVFTMHGITMIFLFVMPMSAAFFNYFLPLMIGARLILVQLARPGGAVLNADQYNQVFTMHGVTMIFLVVMPGARMLMTVTMKLSADVTDPMPSMIRPMVQKSGPWPGRKPFDIGVLVSGA